MEGFAAVVQTITLSTATLVEGAAALIVLFAVLEALVGAAALLRPRPVQPEVNKENLRLRLGRWLSIVLEFLLAADILRTAVAPSWDDIGKLAAIAGIRTALNFFLQREVREAETARGQGLDVNPSSSIQ
jgi:uncharacterized membrane protein